MKQITNNELDGFLYGRYDNRFRTLFCIHINNVCWGKIVESIDTPLLSQLIGQLDNQLVEQLKKRIE